ncbi:MAG: hypothetical protein PW788_03575 [Micavibrio sp.]|nr:hypothetical protein [Micavibrio sp.]
MKKLTDMIDCWDKTHSPAEIVGRFKDLPAEAFQTSAEEEAAAFEALREIEAALGRYVGALTVEKEKIAEMLDTGNKTSNACIAYVKTKRVIRED